jgi:putative membrane protein
MTSSTAAVATRMMDWDRDAHPARTWGWIVMLLLLALIVLVTVLLVRHFAERNRVVATGGRAAPAAGRGAEDILAERFARGEIDEDDFRRRRDALRG